MPSSNWKIITKNVDPNDPQAARLLDEAIAAAPPEFVGADGVPEDTVHMLPRGVVRDRCRLCGNIAELTREHIPPKSSGNKERHLKRTLDDWLEHGTEDEKIKGKTEQGGIFGYTLCRSCNSLTGRLYGNEYKVWTEQANSIFNGFEAGTLGTLDQMIGPFGWNVQFGDKKHGVKPGAMIRQVLSCMCSLSGSWDLAGRYPEIRRIVLEQSAEAMPKGVELGLSLYLGPRIRISGPQLRVDMKTATWRWVQEIAYPPFSFQLVIASNNDDPGLGLMMNEWTLLAPGDQRIIEGVSRVGFGWSPYIGDYRSRGEINGTATRATDGVQND